MTLEFFYNNYSFNDFEVKKVEVKNGYLNIEVLTTAYLELIANGYRPELDVDQHIIFSFKYEENHKFKKPYNVTNVIYDGSLKLTISNINIVITDNNVIVKQGF